MATEKVEVLVTVRGADGARKQIDGIGSSARGASSGVEFLTSAIKGMVGALTIGALVNVADSATRLSNTLKLAGLEGNALVETQDRLYAAGIKNGQSTNALAAIYQKLQANQESLGATGAEFLEVTEGIAASMRLSTAGTAAQEGALTQLSQAFGNPIIQANEYNSLLDGAYPLLQAVAAGMKETGGSVGKLTQMVKNQEVTNKEFFDAFREGSAGMIVQAQQIPLTIGQALFGLQQKFQQILGSVSQTTGVFKLWSDAIVFTTDHLNGILLVLTPVIAGITLLAGAAVIGAGITALANFATAMGVVITAMGKLAIAVTTNPVTGLAILVGLVVASFVDWESVIDRLTGKLNKLDLPPFLKNILGKDTEVVVTVKADEAAYRLDEAGNKIFNMVKSALPLAAKEAEPTLVGALPKGADLAAPKLAEAMKRSGESIAAGIKKAMDERDQKYQAWLEDYDKRQLARYEALNGKHVKEMGDKLIEGGKALINTATGAVTKITPAIEKGGQTAADTINQGMTDGGEAAAAKIEAGVAMSGMAAGQSIYQQLAGLGDVWSNSLQKTIGDLIGRMLNAQYNLMKQQMGLMDAEADKLRAEAEKIRRETDLLGRKIGGGSSSGGGRGISSGSGSAGIPFGDIEYIRAINRYGTSVSGGFAQGGQFMVGGTGAGRDTTPVRFMAERGERVTVETRKQQRANDNQMQAANVTVPVRIVNVNDPNEALAVVASPAGEQVILNTIRNNRHIIANLVGR